MEEGKFDITNLQRLSVAEQLKLLTSRKAGLSVQEVAIKQKQFGLNRVTEQERTTPFRLAVRQFKSPLVFILIGASLVSLLLGQWVDALTILIILLLNGVLGFWQEFHSQKTTEKLKSIIQATCQVRRDHQVIEIPREQIVPGDILIVEPGTVLPADVRWIECDRLNINESVMTGEAASVEKTSSVFESAQANTIFGFAGTHAMSGYGEGVVYATGSHSSLGKIIQLTQTTKRVSSFEQGIQRLSKFILWMVTITLVVVFSVNIATKGTSHAFEELLFAIALAVSVIPEALPTVVTITFTKGALLLSKKKVVVKRLSSIEDLGHIQVLCTDKTGTITQNKMTVKEVSAADKEQTLHLALLASEAQGSSFDEAIQIAIPHSAEILKKWKTVWTQPFDPERKRTTMVVEQAKQMTLISKGAPEVILELCQKVQQKQHILLQSKTFGEAGYRVLAVACKTDPKKIGAVYQEDNLTYAGLIAFEDPLKPTAKQTLAEAKALGVQVKILTGDSPEVARAIAQSVGIMTAKDKIMTGEAFMQLSSAEKQRTVEKIHVFARVTPEEKYSVIQHLQNRYVVGFLGEGINDAPALQLANVGLVVQNASDVAREAADIILLDKSLEVIVDGIKEGRTIFSNVSKYIRYTLIGNFGNFYAIAGISLLLPFLPMLPVQLLLTNLLTDLPLLAIATDRVDSIDILKPQFYNIKEFAFIGIVLGIVSSVFDFMVFGIFRTNTPETIQTLWFITSILTELVLIFSIRSRRFILLSNRPRFSLIALSVLVTGITLSLPFMEYTSRIFHFITPTPHQMLIVLGIVISYFVVTEVCKVLYYKSWPAVVSLK